MLSKHDANSSAAGACNSHPLSQQCHTGKTTHKPLTLYASPTKPMDSLQPYAQKQLVPLASVILQDPTATGRDQDMHGLSGAQHRSQDSSGSPVAEEIHHLRGRQAA